VIQIQAPALNIVVDGVVIKIYEYRILNINQVAAPHIHPVATID
jgi:hypothetical protein